MRGGAASVTWRIALRTVHPALRWPCTLAVLAALLLPAAAQADPWWGRDKALHLGVSLTLGAATYGTLWGLGDDGPWTRLALSGSIAMLPGLAKEIYDDGQPSNSFSGKDMLYNGVGALLGCGLMLSLELWLGRGPARVRRVVLQLGGTGAGARGVF